jgi:hypothetical protein
MTHMTRTRRPRTLIAVLALAAFASACASDPVITTSGEPTPEAPEDTLAPTREEMLEDARVRWAEAGPTSYVMTTRVECFCPQGEWEDVVVDGEVTSHTSSGDEPLFDPGEQTMETLFDEVDEVLSADYVRMDLEFDPLTGALARYWVDIEEMMADEEHGVTVLSVVPLEDGEVS